MKPRTNGPIINIGINTCAPVGTHVVTYEFDNNCCHSIRLCSGYQHLHPYWYVCKPMYKDDDPVAYLSGLRHMYWAADGGWRSHTPKQYETPQEAYDDVKDKL